MTDQATKPTYEALAKMIDHALLAPTLTREQIEAGMRTAIAYDVASTCVMPSYLARSVELLAGTSVKPSTVIGFPLGVVHTKTKVAEARQALADGAVELDMVVNISDVLSGRWQEARDDIAAVLDVAHGGGAKLKVIFETCYLEDAHKRKLCELCGELGVDWVKTSTGFGTGGATDEDLMLMREASPEAVQVKASGGIRTYERLLRVRELGCSRAGASATPAILGEARTVLGLPAIQDETDGQAGY